MAPTAEGPPAAVVRASRSSSNDGENIINRKATTSPSPTTSLGRHHDHLHKTTVSSSSAYVSHPRLSSRYSFHMRWLVLTLNCTLLFGNYYAYDLPAALNTPLQAYLQVDDAEYQYMINTLYSIYSLPNIFLPFLGGWLVDAFGTAKLTVILSAFVCIGQLFFSWGIEAKSFGLMCVGRALFGVGGESLFVSQTRMTTTWFKGKELSFALGINLAMARMGSVLNDFLSPLLGIHHSIPFAMWIGFLTCVASFLCSCYLGYIDSKYDPINGMKRIPSCVPSSSSSSSLLQRRSSRVGRQRHRKHGSAGGDLDSSALLDQLAEEDGIHDEDNDDIFIHQDGSTTTTAEYIDLQEIIPHNSSSFSPSFSSSPTSRLHSHHHHLMKPPTSLSSLLDFPFPFWLIIIAMNLMYATVIPFNTIHSAFLQTKWYKGNPQIAAQVMAVPDTISAVFVPFAGTFADMYGHRVKTLMLCGLVMSVCHLVLGLGTVTTVASPMPALVAMGAGYCLLLTFWPCISLCVRDDRLASAIGLATASTNLSWTLFPIIVAALSNLDPTYTYTLLFFAACCLAGVAVCIWLYFIDQIYYDGIMEMPEKSAAVIAVKPTLTS